MIQLPLSLVRFGRLTCNVYTSLPESIFSGGMLGSRWLTSVGPRCVSLGGVKGVVTFKFSGRLAPRPPLPGRGVGELTLIAAGRLLAPVPPVLPAEPVGLPEPAPPEPEAVAPFFAPVEVPALPPSGEIEMRAARFPSGIF